MMGKLHIAIFAALLAAPAPAGYPDGEASGPETARPPRPPMFSSMKISLAFQASQHGNAEIVFGRAGAEGGLRLSGVSAVAGFDRGEWVVKGDRFRRTLSQAAGTAAPAPRKMAAHLWLDSSGAPLRLNAFTVDGAPFALSPEEEAEVMSFLDPRGWDTFKTVTRGDASAVEAGVSFSPAGSSIILR